MMPCKERSLVYMKEKKKKGGMGWIAAYVVLFLVFIGIGFAVRFAISNIIHDERTIDVSLLKSEVKQINELATYRYDYREIIDSVTSKKKFVALSLNKRFIMTFDGTIKAGIDLNDVDYEISNDNPVTVTVKIPEATILSHEDNNAKTVYEEGLKSEGLGQIRNSEIQKKKEA